MYSFTLHHNSLNQAHEVKFFNILTSVVKLPRGTFPAHGGQPINNNIAHDFVLSFIALASLYHVAFLIKYAEFPYMTMST